MKKLILAAVFALPLIAKADVIVCTFTEPFITATYSMAQQKLSWNDNVTGQTEELRNISFQIMEPGLFELWDANRTVVLALRLDNKGSDGMSQRKFPYSAQWYTKSVYGGCESNFLKATK